MTLLTVRDLATYYGVGPNPVRAVDGVSFEVNPGEIVGLVGESGCGKTTVGFSLMRLLPDVARIARGEVLFEGKDLLRLSPGELRGLRGNRMAMIFQDPMSSLDPAFSIGEQIMEPLREHLGMGHDAARKRAIELLTQVGIPSPEERLRRYPHEFSGGMRQRVVIAIALACNPALLICDEPTSALDVTVQAQILNLLRSMRTALQQTGIIMITHDLGVVAQLCDRVAVMYAGQIVEQGPVRDIFASPRHPYTQGLLDSLPGRVPRGTPLRQIDGTVPDLRHPPSGCRFAPRCVHARAACLAPVAFRQVGRQDVACVLFDEEPDRVS
ncbi:MAG: ABC transporter ATP-binding protein, partial [Thermomicrobiales bacterium]|nr:ABC transporter ATP-binding protein [Thermomicrobiales bacterium]